MNPIHLFTWQNVPVNFTVLPGRKNLPWRRSREWGMCSKGHRWPRTRAAPDWVSARSFHDNRICSEEQHQKSFKEGQSTRSLTFDMCTQNRRKNKRKRLVLKIGWQGQDYKRETNEELEYNRKGRNRPEIEWTRDTRQGSTGITHPKGLTPQPWRTVMACILLNNLNMKKKSV